MGHDDAPWIVVSGTVWVPHEPEKAKSSGGNGCAGNSEQEREFFIQPFCGDGEDQFTLGRFDGKNDTINMDCKGKIADKERDTVSGTLHVDAYTFVLPRDALSQEEWRHDLLKQHHDYPAADIPVSAGTPFYAVTAGTVKSGASTSCGPFGIMLRGFDGIHYTYCHNSKRTVEIGQVVPPGTELGVVGGLGSAKGHAHLHFEIRLNGSKASQRCPQALLWDLYDNAHPAPDAKFVEALPTQSDLPACWYPKGNPPK